MPRTIETTEETAVVILHLTGTPADVEQAIADLMSNIQYDNLAVTVKQVYDTLADKAVPRD